MYRFQNTFLIAILILILQGPAFSQNKFKGVIAAVINDAGMKSSIVTIDSTGTVKYLIDKHDIYGSLVFSPDGRYIAYTVLRDTVLYDISDLNLEENENFEAIYDNTEYPKPTEDGEGIVFQVNDIFIMNINGSEKRKISKNIDLRMYSFLRWSPDGSKLICTVYNPYGITKGEIWEIEINSGKETKLEVFLGKYHQDHMDYGIPDYSPDGRYIIFQCWKYGAAQYQLFIKDVINEKVYYYYSDDTAVSAESFATRLQWSPLGDRILFIKQPHAAIRWTNKLHELVSGHFLKSFSPLTGDNVIVRNVYFSPNGQNIAYTLEINGEKSLWISDNNFKNPYKVLDGFNIIDIAWGGYPRAPFTGVIEIDAEEVLRYEISYLIIYLIFASVFSFILVFAVSYKNNPMFWYLTSIVMFAGYFVWFGVTPGPVISSFIAFSFAAAVYSGHKMGKFFQKEIMERRKLLLLSLLEFGHSGSIMKNLDHLILHASNIYKGGKVDRFAQKKLIESWRDFQRRSATNIEALTKQVKKALYSGNGKEISSNLRKILLIPKSGLFYENDSFIDSINELRMSIEKLEQTVDRDFTCNISDLIEFIIRSNEDLIKRNGLSSIQVRNHNSKQNMAKIDEVDFEFIFDNLIKNAVNSVRNTTEKSITVELQSDATRYYIRVLDSGKGIPENMWEQIFLPGYSDSGSTGAGLYYSREKLVKYKGYLKVESSIPGKGTTFLLTLRIPK